MTMTQSQNRIIGKFLNFIQSQGGPLSNWYVGVSEDARRRLFIEHGVEPTDPHIIEIADNVKEAREVETFFINKGMDGAPGGGDDTNMVYAYKKMPHTKP